LEDNAVADPAVLADYRVGVSEEVIADFGATINRYETMQDRVLAEFGFFIDEAVRSMCAPSGTRAVRAMTAVG
jgi:hypothetical protein